MSPRLFSAEVVVSTTRGSERHEGVGVDELPDLGVRAQIAPPEHPAQEAQPVRVASPKLGRDRHGFVVGEEALLGHERLPAEAHLDGGDDAERWSEVRSRSVHALCGPTHM